VSLRAFGRYNEQGTDTMRQLSKAASSARGSSTEQRDRCLAGVIMFVSVAQFMTVIVLAAAIAPDYDFKNAAISDLGSIDSTAVLFNCSVIAVGLSNVIAGYFYFRVHGQSRLMAIFAVAGIAAVGVGLFPVSRFEIHRFFALLAFVFFNVQVLTTGSRLSGPMRTLAVVSGAVGLVFIAVMTAGDSGHPSVFGPIGHGGTERMIVYPPMMWLAALGGYLLATPAVRRG
jgi:hypothetical membrane protein